MFMPWHCEEERHTYEICLYQEYERRRIMKTEMRRQAKEQG